MRSAIFFFSKTQFKQEAIQGYSRKKFKQEGAEGEDMDFPGALNKQNVESLCVNTKRNGIY